jgi:DNA-binding HxlR family transcriptional regulator
MKTPALTSRNCPVTLAIQVMGRKWKPLILYYLKDGPKRFGELRRCIPETSQKILTQTLREMEADGILVREVRSQIPPNVSYSISRRGKSLDPILIALKRWGVRYRKNGERRETAGG